MSFHHRRPGVDDDAEAGKRKDSAWQAADSDQDESGSEQIDQRIEALTIALAPVLLPMIESLGALHRYPGNRRVSFHRKKHAQSLPI